MSNEQQRSERPDNSRGGLQRLAARGALATSVLTSGALLYFESQDVDEAPTEETAEVEVNRVNSVLNIALVGTVSTAVLVLVSLTPQAERDAPPPPVQPPSGI